MYHKKDDSLEIIDYLDKIDNMRLTFLKKKNLLPPMQQKCLLQYAGASVVCYGAVEYIWYVIVKVASHCFGSLGFVCHKLFLFFYFNPICVFIFYYHI